MLNKIEKTYTKDSIIIIGDWSIGKQMKNCISTPNLSLKRKLQERFKVYNIDKYRTSCLNYKTEELSKNLYLVDKRNKKRKIHSILTYKMVVKIFKKFLTIIQNMMNDQKDIREELIYKNYKPQQCRQIVVSRLNAIIYTDRSVGVMSSRALHRLTEKKGKQLSKFLGIKSDQDTSFIIKIQEIIKNQMFKLSMNDYEMLCGDKTMTKLMSKFIGCEEKQLKKFCKFINVFKDNINSSPESIKNKIIAKKISMHQCEEEV